MHLNPSIGTPSCHRHRYSLWSRILFSFHQSHILFVRSTSPSWPKFLRSLTYSWWMERFFHGMAAACLKLRPMARCFLRLCSSVKPQQLHVVPEFGIRLSDYHRVMYGNIHTCCQWGESHRHSMILVCFKLTMRWQRYRRRQGPPVVFFCEGSIDLEKFLLECFDS